MRSSELLVEELEEDELAPPSNSWSKRKVFSKKPTVLPVRGGEWIVDSGSSFHIVSPADMTTSEKRRTYPLGSPVPLNTAQGKAKVTKAVSLVPIQTGTERMLDYATLACSATTRATVHG